MILILGGPGDDSADAIQHELERRGAAVARFDPDSFSSVGAVSLALGGAGRLDGVLSPGGRAVYVEDISAVWFGRPGRFAANPVLEDLWDVLDAEMLPAAPLILERASHNLRQQRAANDVGFQVSGTGGDARPQMRVVVAGDKVFAVAVTSSTTPTPIAAYVLPAEDAARCKELVKALNLEYATIDFATMPENQLVFLRLDPHGRFNDIEKTTSMPIGRAVAELLISRSQAAMPITEHAAALVDNIRKHSFFSASRSRHPSTVRRSTSHESTTKQKVTQI